MEKVFWELSESFWVLSIQINQVRERVTSLFPPHTTFLGPSVFPSYRPESDHQHPQHGYSRGTSTRWPEDIYPEAGPTRDKQRTCPEGTGVREIPREQ